MRKVLLMLSALAFVSLAASGVAMACGGAGATACCATKAAAKTATQASGLAPMTALPAPAPAVVPFSTLPVSRPQPLVSGLWAFINPETGTIDGSIGLMQAPMDIVPVDPDYSNLPQIQLPNGSWMVDTRGIMLDNFGITIDAFGRRTFTCTRDAKLPTFAPIVVSPIAER
jgi:hypothetical protein